MILFAAALLVIAVIVFILFVRTADLPEPEPVSPVKYLEERKERIYEGLRDLQFEYRLGKLSDEDYQHTKFDLQKDLAQVLSEIDDVGRAPSPAAGPLAGPVTTIGTVCPHCGATFPQPLKFCGECGKSMHKGDA